MLRSAFHVLAIILGIAVALTIGLWAARGMISINGGASPVLLLAQSPIAALGFLLAGLCAIMVAGLIVDRVSGPGAGFVVLASGLFAWTTQTGTASELARLPHGPITRIPECIFWAGVLWISSWLILQAMPKNHFQSEKPSGAACNVGFTSRLSSIGASLLVLPVVWLLAQTELKGQMLGACTLGACVAALASRLLCADDRPAWYATVCALPALVGGIGYLLAGIVSDEPLVGGFPTDLGVLLLPMPQDFASGAILGTFLGFVWAQSFAHTGVTTGGGLESDEGRPAKSVRRT